MKIGIMQPYLFPYIGYFQLIRAVDQFVLYDDVNYIRRGWINRNRILLNGRPRFLTLSVSGASQNKRINHLTIAGGEADSRSQMLDLVCEAYRRAPYFQQVYPIVERVLTYQTDSLSQLLRMSVTTIAGYLGLGTEIGASSSIEYDRTLKGEGRIVGLCKTLKASTYVNPIGGVHLYNKDRFADEGIALRFLQTREITYSQRRDGFVPNLSIIDVLMFNGTDEIARLLGEYDLV